MKKWIFKISILLNIIFLFLFIRNWRNSPSNELGRLEKEIKIGYFQTDQTVFKIPKVITVKNASKRGLGALKQFKNKQFPIVITSDDPNLVNYNLPEDSLKMFGNCYATEIQQSESKPKSKPESKPESKSEIPQGSFVYELYFSEFSGRMENAECKVTIKGTNIIVEQTENTNLSGDKIIIEGTLMRHRSGRWIIGQNPEDKDAEEIGGCSDGPTPIDFKTKIIELC